MTALAAAAGAAALCGSLALPAAAAAAAPPAGPVAASTEGGTPADAPTEAPTQAPADAPPDVPADAPPDVPADAPTDAPPDAPTDALTEPGAAQEPEVPPAEVPPAEVPAPPPPPPGPDPVAVAAYEAAVAASADASVRLAEVSARASAALEARDAARARYDAAVAERAHQQDVAASSATLVAQGRSAVGRWASSAYRGAEHARGGMPVASALLGSSTTDQVGSQLSLLAAVGRQRAGAVRGALDAELVAEQAVARAATAEQEAVLAQERADAEAALADAALAEQRDLAAAVDAELAAARSRLGVPVDAAQEASDLARAAAGTAPVDLPAGAGGCASSDVSGYPNGQIPVAALCPLESAPGHLLRADAARSFDAMSRAYALAFGTPLCVTDSYRPLAAQIAVRATKPHLAAVPGTSRHGLGRAVDLCGGVEDFGTVQHEWVVQRAPLFGWFHPSWARAGGSKPEPWHFEYAESAGGSSAS